MPLNKGKNCYITNLLNTCKLPFYVHNIHMNNDFLVLHQIKVSKNTSALAGKSRTYQGRVLCHSFDFLNLLRFLQFSISQISQISLISLISTVLRHCFDFTARNGFEVLRHPQWSFKIDIIFRHGHSTILYV